MDYKAYLVMDRLFMENLIVQVLSIYSNHLYIVLLLYKSMF